MADYNAAIESNEKCVSAYNNRASLYVDMGRYEMALFDADTGLFIYENHGNLYKHRGLAHFYLGHYNQCLLDIQKSIQFAPKYRPARIALKMIWEFFFMHLVDIVSDMLHCDVCKLLIDYMVGDNYETDEDMVDATYADWKKEMALMEQEKERIQSSFDAIMGDFDDDDDDEKEDEDDDKDMN